MSFIDLLNGVPEIAHPIDKKSFRAFALAPLKILLPAVLGLWNR
jgi:hypothetical protein